MRAWDVPNGQSIRLPKGNVKVGQDKSAGWTMYRNARARKYYKITSTMTGWHIEEWGYHEVGSSGCDTC
jgi:hypothetical protein